MSVSVCAYVSLCERPNLIQNDHSTHSPLPRSCSNQQDKKNLISLINFLTENFMGHTSPNYRKGGLIALAAVAIGLGGEIHTIISDIVDPILRLLLVLVVLVVAVVVGCVVVHLLFVLVFGLCVLLIFPSPVFLFKMFHRLRPKS